MAEQLICNQQVDGSTPFTSSNESAMAGSNFGGFPERPKGADCKSVVTDFGGPNPPSPTKIKSVLMGCFFILVRVRWQKAAINLPQRSSRKRFARLEKTV